MPTQQQQLSFAVRAVNEASKVLADVQKDLGTTAGEVEKSSSKLEAMGKHGSSAAGALGDVSKIAGGFVLAQGMIAAPQIIGSIADRAKDLELQGKKAATVFGDQLGTVRSWADENAAAMGLTTREATNLAAGLADLLVPMGMSREEAAQMSTTTIGLAGALAEWSGGQKNAAEVSEILQSAYLGETDGLKALGISISAADVQTRLAAKGQEELTGAAAQQAQALAIQELIFEKSTDAQAAFANGSGSASRAQAEFGATVRELKDDIAVGLMPVLTKIAQVVVQEVVPAIASFANWWSTDAQPKVEAFINFIKPGIEGMAAVIGEKFGQINGWYEQDLKPVLEKGLAGFQAIVGFVRDHWGEISAVIGPVIDQVVLYLNTVWTVFSNIVGLVANLITGDWSGAWGNAKAIFSGVWDYITGSIDNLDDLIRGVIPLITDAASALMGAFFEALKGSLGALADVIEAIGKGIANGVIDVMNAAIKLINDYIPDKISLPGIPDIDLPDNPIPTIPHMAKGGIVTEPTLALIGEAGPEAVVPLDRLARAPGRAQQQTIEIHFHGFVGDVGELSRTLRAEFARSL